jgi:hypothetical protein
VCAALATAAVQKPEHDVLHKAIVSMRLIEEPFKELQDFRCECVPGDAAQRHEAQRSTEPAPRMSKPLHSGGFENSRNGHNGIVFEFKTF